MSANAERLAWRPANDNVRFWKLGFRRQRDLLAITFEISPVSFTGIRILLEAERFKSLRLETQRQPTTTSKQIQHTDFSVWIWPEQRIDSFDVIHFPILIFAENLVEHDFNEVAGLPIELVIRAVDLFEDVVVNILRHAGSVRRNIASVNSVVINWVGRHIAVLNFTDADTVSLQFVEFRQKIADLTSVRNVPRMSKDVQSAFRRLDIANRCN